MATSSGKLCFVTIGATAGFNDLIKVVLDDKFLKALQAEGYTDLRVQYGKEGAPVFKAFEEQQATADEKVSSISVTGFDFKRDGLQEEMLAAKGRGKKEGVVISHAGSGSILDALRVEAPLIVVPNSTLLNNHQVELAVELARLDYVVHGTVDELDVALRGIENFRERKKVWPPPLDTRLDPTGAGLVGVMDYEMGFVD